jgi:hypothetical protein
MGIGGVGNCSGEVHAEAFGCSGTFNLGGRLVGGAPSIDDEILQGEVGAAYIPFPLECFQIDEFSSNILIVEI